MSCVVLCNIYKYVYVFLCNCYSLKLFWVFMNFNNLGKGFWIILEKVIIKLYSKELDVIENILINKYIF